MRVTGASSELSAALSMFWNLERRRNARTLGKETTPALFGRCFLQLGVSWCLGLALACISVRGD